MTRRLELQPALEAEEEPNRTLSEIMMHLKCVRQLRFPQASLLNKSFSFHWFGVAVCPERLLNGSAWGRLEGLRVPLGEKFRGGFSEAASAVGNQVLILPGQSLTVHVLVTTLMGLPARLSEPSVSSRAEWRLGRRSGGPKWGTHAGTLKSAGSGRARSRPRGDSDHPGVM